jgi:lysophospholipase L1-like esterase
MEMGVETMAKYSEIWERIERLAQERHGKPAYVILQAQAGVSGSTIQLIRNGYIPKRADTRQRIANALGVPVGDLFQIADEGRD